MTLDNFSKTVDVLIKSEIHAIVIMLMGVGLVLHGHSTEGQLAMGGALGILKGRG